MRTSKVQSKPLIVSASQHLMQWWTPSLQNLPRCAKTIHGRPFSAKKRTQSHNKALSVWLTMMHCSQPLDSMEGKLKLPNLPTTRPLNCQPSILTSLCLHNRSSRATQPRRNSLSLRESLCPRLWPRCPLSAASHLTVLHSSPPCENSTIFRARITFHLIWQKEKT